ncbi:DgyrCDS7959 [Dimorphilus gyrociliatus]|uniref:Prolyl endopeptidase n=1 Tax=Dimorphilus gyrociliatus TaxID=2664684 RepID=A0A7I8VSQ5_9ANNE|nr:DgyrCDS7959 [Dimorphilus gyrociliatus]
MFGPGYALRVLSRKVNQYRAVIFGKLIQREYIIATKKMNFDYPLVCRNEKAFDEYHGQKIADPYRWLEDPDSSDTKTFVENQNKISEPFIQAYPFRKQLHDTIKKMWDYPKYGCPRKRGDNYYYSYNTGLQNQSVIYCQKTLDSEAEVFFDPNTLSTDGTVALSSTAFSKDNKHYAFGLSEQGSDWLTIKVKDVATRIDKDDLLKNVKFTSLSWTHDHKGFFYNRYPKSEGKADGTETDMNLNHKLYYHFVGDDQSQDVLVAEFPDNPKWMIGAEVTDDGRYVVLSIAEGCEHVNRLYFVDLKDLGDKSIKEFGKVLPYTIIVDNFDAEWEYITNNGTMFVFRTNKDSPRSKLVTIDISKGISSLKDLVPQHEKDVLEWSACVRDDLLILCYIRDVKNVLEVRDVKTGKLLKDLPLPIGSITSFEGRKEQSHMFYGFTSFLEPGIIYQVDFTKPQSEWIPTRWKQIVVPNLKSDEFETEQVFYESKDKAKIPMFIVKHKNVKKDGKAPALVYVYGGFNISIMPSFSVSRIVWMLKCGGILAVANIRGGGEYGEDWHHLGTKEKKFNCFDDTAYATKYLSNNGYSSSDRIAIQGGSNGGLVVCATANRYPSDFAAVISQVGVLDMLKFHKFTIGHAWTTDYGCADIEEDFKYIKEFSPLHSIPSTTACSRYPSTLILTADHDDRVVPLHSLKFTAELQHVQGGNSKKNNKPLIALIDTKAGHGGGKPTGKIIEELVNVYSFLSLVLQGVEWKD